MDVAHARHSENTNYTWCSNAPSPGEVYTGVWTNTTCIFCLAAGIDAGEPGARDQLAQLQWTLPQDLPADRSPTTVERWLAES